MFEIFFEISTLRILLAGLMLGVASIIDVRNREIPDVFWIVFGAITLIILFFEDNIVESLIIIALSMIIVPFVLLMWRFGFFGGADAFSLIVLGGLAPLATIGDNVVTPFTTLSNAVFFIVLLIIINLLRNVFAILNHENIFSGFKESKWRKMIAILLGFRSKNPKFGFSIERVEENYKRFDFSLHHADTAPFSHSPNSWITPALPFILFITTGFVIQLFFGDILIQVFLGLSKIGFLILY